MSLEGKSGVGIIVDYGPIFFLTCEQSPGSRRSSFPVYFLVPGTEGRVLEHSFLNNDRWYKGVDAYGCPYLSCFATRGYIDGEHLDLARSHTCMYCKALTTEELLRFVIDFATSSVNELFSVVPSRKVPICSLDEKTLTFLAAQN